ncbi:hypothetical protein AJ78_00380 [Emergomyces pasteurianus Ep9510]|uniref:Major facilitator superfamily (MFS) profile domain-containing protein n=1 Tax=Emergomyces pasteurianus Ep9510 TaxID=1447872 RepID=A0A1J9PTB6_9EURO|nr:hypothetical protein AJ78_00380 [Emergomyces pasteurianus Ep9510]
MKNHMDAGWFYSPRQIQHYFTTRISSLKPPKTDSRNPFHILRGLNRHQWLMFLVGYLAWVWDGFDYFSICVSSQEIADEFGVSSSQVSGDLTSPVILRSVGALLSGLCADRYGRKWPMIVNLALFVVLEFGTGFCNNLDQLMAVRSLFGVSMGGLLGTAATTAVEDLPYDAKGLMSGVFQQGCPLGYLLASNFYRILGPNTAHGWRSMFWFGAIPPSLVIIIRWYLPETNHFQALKAEREARTIAVCSAAGEDQGRHICLRAFIGDARRATKDNWLLFVFMILFMAGFHSCSQDSENLYPNLLTAQSVLPPTSSISTTTAMGQVGAIIGSTLFGYLSSIFGRRLTMLIACIFGGSIVPALVNKNPEALSPATICEQFFIGGVWGPIPIYLLELTPQALRSLIVGFTYQMGNMASTATGKIPLSIGKQYPLPDSETGMEEYDNTKGMTIYMGAVWAYMFILLFLGPEMTQEERDEEAAASKELDELQDQGMNPAQVGEVRARLLPEQASKNVKQGNVAITEADDPSSATR